MTESVINFPSQAVSDVEKMSHEYGEKVAKAINVTFQQIQKYEKGKNAVSVHNELKLAEFLNCDRNYFIQPITENGYKFLTKRGNGHDNQK